METMTVNEVLAITIRNLQNILVPAGLTNEIAIPLSQNIGNLQECLIALQSNTGMKPKDGTPEEIPEETPEEDGPLFGTEEAEPEAE